MLWSFVVVIGLGLAQGLSRGAADSADQGTYGEVENPDVAAKLQALASIGDAVPVVASSLTLMNRPDVRSELQKSALTQAMLKYIKEDETEHAPGRAQPSNQLEEQAVPTESGEVSLLQIETSIFDAQNNGDNIQNKKRIDPRPALALGATATVAVLSTLLLAQDYADRSLSFSSIPAQRYGQDPSSHASSLRRIVPALLASLDSYTISYAKRYGEQMQDPNQDPFQSFSYDSSQNSAFSSADPSAHSSYGPLSSASSSSKSFVG